MDKTAIYNEMINVKNELENLKKKYGKYNECLAALRNLYNNLDNCDNMLSEGNASFKNGGYNSSGNGLHSEQFEKINTQIDDVEIEINSLITKTSGKISLMKVDIDKLNNKYINLKNKYESL